jgi:hypothetical protein
LQDNYTKNQPKNKFHSRSKKWRVRSENLV